MSAEPGFMYAVWVALVALPLLLSASHAQTGVPIDAQPGTTDPTEELGFEEMVDIADEIVIGTVESSEGRWEGRFIVTTSEVAVHESLKGRPGSRVQIRQMGGTAVHPRLGERVTMKTSGIALLRTGEEMLLFVHESRPGWRQVVGGDRGQFHLERDPDSGTRVTRAGPKKLRVTREGGRSEIRSEAVALDDLRRRIEERLSARAQHPERESSPPRRQPGKPVDDAPSNPGEPVR